MQIITQQAPIKPRPTRSEIIEAMAIVQFEKHTHELAEKLSIAEDLENKALQSVNAWFQRNSHRLIPSLNLGYLYQGKLKECDFQVNLRHDDIPEEIRKEIIMAIEARDAIPRTLKLEQIKQQIKNALSSQSKVRVAEIVEKSRAALESALDELQK